MINPSNGVSYWSFGYIPTGRLVRDLYRRFTGFPNLGKRLQARRVMDALAVKPDERVLDLGCGIGYFTVELAKRGKEAVGIDVNQDIGRHPIPSNLTNRLRYIVGDGRGIPVPDQYFDVALCSEVLMMIPDPAEFLAEVRRVMKPGGRIIVVNGLGHPAVEEGYAQNTLLMRIARARYGDKVPPTYDGYRRALQGVFATAFAFRDSEYYKSLINANGFTVVSESFAPSKPVGSYLSWSQFFHYLRTGHGVTHSRFLSQYIPLAALSLFQREGYRGGQILVAKVQ